MHVKLIQYLKKLEYIAFGPWLNKYKQLFTSDELETELFDIIIQAQENKKHFNKELFILSNNVIEREKKRRNKAIKSCYYFFLRTIEQIYILYLLG